MFDLFSPKALLAVGILLACVGCRDREAGRRATAESAPAYQAAVPELPELEWKDVRAFNLPLNNPPHVYPEEAQFMRKTDAVLGVILGDEARAYPWDLLKNFHAVNDYLDGQPIIVNMCEACNGGAAFLATVPDTVIDIRPRGLKNGTWYGIDFQTGSLWYPFIGEAFEGPLTGTKLERIRVYFSTWGDWIREQPNTTIALSSQEMRMRPHGRASRMADPTTFNPEYVKRITSAHRNPRRNLLPGHTLVFGLIPQNGETAKAFTVESLGDTKSLVQTTLDDLPILLLAQNEYQIGAYLRQNKGAELTFELTSRVPLLMKDQGGNSWDMWGRTVRGPDHPSELALADGYLAKWYEWIENFPETEVVPIE